MGVGIDAPCEFAIGRSGGNMHAHSRTDAQVAMQEANVWPSLLQSDTHVSGPEFAHASEKASATEHNGKDGSVVHVLQALH
eukprot:2794546-Heterocapsa_arctica.AAC.1